MSSDRGKLQVYTWLSSVIAVWLVTSKVFNIWGEPMMLVHGILLTVISYIPLVLPRYIHKKSLRKR